MILGPLWWAFDARAQGPSEFSSMSEQWQLTVDVMKAKAHAIVIKNSALQSEYQQLMEQKQELEQALKDEQDKNETIRRFLQQRHGRTDQQVQLEQLKQAIKVKKRQARDSQEQLIILKRKQEGLAHQKRKKFFPMVASVPMADEQLRDLRKRLEAEKQQEVMLENELSTLKSSGQFPNLNMGAIEDQNKELVPDASGALPWPLEKKKLMHEMIEADANNDQLRERIKMLRGDVDILRDQVAKLQHQADFIKGKDKPGDSYVEKTQDPF